VVVTAPADRSRAGSGSDAPSARSTINWKTVAIGAVVAAAIAVPASLLAPDKADDTGNLGLALLGILLLGLVLGGFIAARGQPDYPFLNGALAPFLTSVVLQLFGIVHHAGDPNHPINPFSIIFLCLLAASCGLVGGAISYGQRQRAAAKESGEPGDR
jgi:putative membrane protein (TIGR04086 family)